MKLIKVNVCLHLETNVCQKEYTWQKAGMGLFFSSPKGMSKFCPTTGRSFAYLRCSLIDSLWTITLCGLQINLPFFCLQYGNVTKINWYFRKLKRFQHNFLLDNWTKLPLYSQDRFKEPFSKHSLCWLTSWCEKNPSMVKSTFSCLRRWWVN